MNINVITLPEEISLTNLIEIYADYSCFIELKTYLKQGVIVKM